MLKAMTDNLTDKDDERVNTGHQRDLVIDCSNTYRSGYWIGVSFANCVIH